MLKSSLQRVSTVALFVFAATALTHSPSFAQRKSNFQPITLYAKEQRSNKFDACKHHFPHSEALRISDFGNDAVGLCSDSFASLYSGTTKTPLVVVERLNRAMLASGKGLERSENFYPDPRVKAEHRSDLKDYAKSGMDRGHLSPAANQPTPQAMAQSFALSNMVPQAPTMNRGVWNKLEQDTRKYISRAIGDVYVYTGALFLTQPAQTIGKGKVWVPSHLYKAVYHPNSGKHWVHVVENSNEAEINPPVGYGEFSQKYGIRLIPVLDGKAAATARRHSYSAE